MHLQNMVSGICSLSAPRKGYVLRCVACLLALVLISGICLAAPCNPAYRVNVTVDGSEWEYVSSQNTVGDMLSEAGVGLGTKDIVQPALKTRLSQGLKIRVIRITERTVTQKEPIRFKTVIKFDPKGSQERVVACEGVPGEKEVTYHFTYKDGVRISSKVDSAKIIKQPVNEVVKVSKGHVLSGRGDTLASRSGSYVRSLTMVATAYDPGPRSCGKYANGYTATGMKAGKGVAAVDPRVIRLGTKLYVDGYGFCIAADTGGAIKGNRIDLCFNTYREAIKFGRKHVKVYVLE